MQKNVALSAAMLVLALVVSGADGLAAGLQIAPVVINVLEQEAGVSMTLGNTGARPLYAQLRVFAWDHSLTEDRLAPTSDIVASPPMIEIGPGETQRVRVLAVGHRGLGEQTFRLIVDEIPMDDALEKTGVVVRMRYSVPVFLDTRPEAEPEVRLSLVPSGQGWALRLDNAGTYRAQLGAVRLSQNGHRYDVSRGLMGYAFGGRSREWKIDEPMSLAPGAPVEARAAINGMPLEMAVGWPSSP